MAVSGLDREERSLGWVTGEGEDDGGRSTVDSGDASSQPHFFTESFDFCLK